MDTSTPVIFSDGTVFFDNLSRDYIRHHKAYFILAPSGAGKTRFVNSQQEKHWIDGDVLWPSANADLSHDGWDVPFEAVMEINNKSDVITHEAKKLGFWIIGSSNNWLKPDAIVLPKWSRHKLHIAKREKTIYDGGATTSDLEGIKSHRDWIRKWRKHGVPCFLSVEEAAHYLENL
jgi:hypothetical protein